MNPKLELRGLKTMRLDSATELECRGRRTFLITASGYEKRSTFIPKKFVEMELSSRAEGWLVLGFKDFRREHSRPKNDAFYTSIGLEIKEHESKEADAPLANIGYEIRRLVRGDNPDPVSVHIDYSCMPRHWYTALPLLLEAELRACDDAWFWYAEGNYDELELPTAGVEDFSICTGRPSLVPKSRTHIMGLGLDAPRSMSIYRVIDPENVVAFYATGGKSRTNEGAIVSKHRNIIARSDLYLGLPLENFHSSLSTLCTLAKQYQEIGDVIFVPDGPKPLILASALVPSMLQATGILSVHVNRRRLEQFVPIDVEASGAIYGFRFLGR